MAEYMETISNTFFQIILPALITIVLPLLVVLARSVTKKLTEKLDTETRSTVQDMVNSVVSQGVAYAEQYAKTQKRFAQGQLGGEHKLEMATRFIAVEAKKYKLPDMTAGEIRNKVDSYLGIGTLNKNFIINEESDENELNTVEPE